MLSAASMPLFMAVCVPLILGTFIKPGLQPIRAPPGKVSLGTDWTQTTLVSKLATCISKKEKAQMGTRYLITSLVESSGSIRNSVSSLKCGTDRWVMLPALELSEWTQVRVGIVQTHLNKNNVKNVFQKQPRPICKSKLSMLLLVTVWPQVDVLEAWKMEKHELDKRPNCDG